MKPAKQQIISVLAILVIALAQFAYPQPAQAARLCNGATSSIYYVDPNSPAETPDGCSWDTAYHTLQDALTDTSLASGNQVWVADGTYYPDEGASQVNNDRESVFLIENGVKVYGGYAGYGATDPDERNEDPATNNTILSGDIDGNPANNTNNAYHVVGAVNISSLTELSGFTIQNGNAGGSNAFGGGMYVSNASNNLKLKNLIITSNSAYNGGGLAAIETELSLERVKFIGNTSQNYGGGLYSQDGSPTLLDVTFENNQTQISTAPGAGMHSTDTNTVDYTVAPVLTNVTFKNNNAQQGGGGGMFNNLSHAVLNNVTFAGNQAGVRGGGMLNEGSNVVLNNVTFSGNTAPAGTGAAIRNINSTTGESPTPSAVTVTNTILWETTGVDIVNDADNTITIDDSVMQDAACPTGGTCTNVKFNENPALSALANNGGFTQTMAIGVGGSAMDAGNNGTCEGTDQRGVSRPQDGDGNGSAVCDMGAYEYEVGGLQATTTTINSDNPDPSIIGQAVTVSVTVSGTTTPTGTVSITGANTNCNISLVGGSGSCNVNFTFAGDKSLVATYNGDGSHAPSVDTEAHTVSAAGTTTTIDSHLPNPSVVGETVTVEFTVTSGSGTPTGDVTVTDGQNSCVGTVAQGSCDLTLTTAGQKTLTATYEGNLDFASSSDSESHTVNQASTTTTITSDSPDPSGLSQPVKVNYTVVVDSPGNGTPTGNVTVSDGVNSCVATVAAGTCNIALTTLGARTLTATYAGDSNFAGSVSAGVPHTVNEASTTTAITSDLPDPSVVGQAVTVNYTVNTNGGGTPTGNVTVTDGVNSCVGTVAAGSCKITLTTVGARVLTASYAGDTNHGGSISVGVPHTVVNSNKKTMKSIATQDGWLLETSENSNKGGTLNNGATTFYLGDDAQDKQFRAILSFSTKGLPDTAVITKVTLKVKQQSVIGGGNPVNTFQGFVVDAKKGFFGTKAGLQANDFQAKPNKSVGPTKPAVVNGWYTINLTPAKNAINLLSTNGGVTQLRLRFKLDDNNNNIANYLNLYSGNAPVASRPQLIIEYYVP